MSKSVNEYKECDSSQQTKYDSYKEYVDDSYVDLNNAIFSRITSNEPLPRENEEAIFEIITSGIAMNDEIGEIQKIWTMISSQLLYQSFLNCLQNMISGDAQNYNSHILLNVIDAITDRGNVRNAEDMQDE